MHNGETGETSKVMKAFVEVGWIQ